MGIIIKISKIVRILKLILFKVPMFLLLNYSF